ncbi:glycosyltransferase family 4 protein [bacterium]|nr:glycosyltransferase family 4 protein [bacterium]
MSKPRVAIVHYSSPPVIGGVEFILEAHAKEMLKHGYKVKVVAGRGERFHKNIPVAIIPGADSLSKVNKEINAELERGVVSAKFYRLTDSIYRRLTQELKNVDLAIIHNVLTMHFNLSFTAALEKYIREHPKKRFIAWCHDATFNDPIYKKKAKNRYPWNMISRPIPKVRYVAISCQRQRQLSHLFQINSKKITVVPDGIDHRSFLDLNEDALKIFKKFNLFNRELVILLPTRMVKRKNLELAIKITKELNKKLRSTLIITGPPDPHNIDSMRYYRSLKDLRNKSRTKKKVIFLYEEGIKVDYSILRSLYLLCDMLLFPSTQEGFGIPLLESGLVNLPVACANIPSLKELGEKDVHYLDLKKNPRELASGIIKYYRRQPTIPMFKKVLRNYTWESIFKQKIEPLLTKQ